MPTALLLSAPAKHTLLAYAHLRQTGDMFPRGPISRPPSSSYYGHSGARLITPRNGHPLGIRDLGASGLRCKNSKKVPLVGTLIVYS